MPFVTSDEQSIYYELAGTPDQPPLVLMHWFMGSHQTWYDIGWVRELEPHFQLVLVDHRGYGRSSKPHEPEAYDPRHHVEDLVALLDHLQLDQAHFMGYSMGGRIGFALAAYAPERVQSLVIGGMHPYSSDQIPTDLDERVDLLQQGMEITLKTYGIGPPQVFDRMLQNDAQALLADSLQTKKWPGLGTEIRDFDHPTLLFVGKEDGFYEGMKSISQQMPDARFVAFPGENHRTAFLKRTLLVPHLRRFYHY